VRRTRKDDEELERLEDVNLGDVEKREQQNRRTVRLGEVGKVDAVVRAVHHAATTIWERKFISKVMP
jgi:uncharacterized protein (DUF4213/DUF364 family)